MIIGASYFYNIPGMAVFDSLVRIISADGNDTPYSQGIQKNLYGFGNTFTYNSTIAATVAIIPIVAAIPIDIKQSPFFSLMYLLL